MKCTRHPKSDIVPGKRRCALCIAWDHARIERVRKSGMCRSHSSAPVFFGSRCSECYISSRLARLRRHGLSKVELTKARKAMEDFDGLCEICGRKTPGNADHCHTRKVFRGILCRPCNSYIANIGDNADTAIKLVSYLLER